MTLSERLIIIAATALAAVSCISANQQLGQDFLPGNFQYDIKSDNFGIKDIQMDTPDGLSGYSLYRFTFGSIRDEFWGETSRATAVTIVPLADSLDFGKKGTLKVRQFHFAGVPDTTSYVDASQKYILQNVHVYALSETPDYTKPNPELKIDRSAPVSMGIPVYNGKDSLSFDFREDFTKAFIEKYRSLLEEKSAQGDTIKIDEYQKIFPGIFIETDAPMSDGGRINMFKLPMDVYNSTIYGSYAELKFTAEYGDRGPVDTSFVFCLGAAEIYDMYAVTSTTVAMYPQVAYNLTSEEPALPEGADEDKIYFEGGMGLKPVIKAESLREQILSVMAAEGVDDISKVVVNKASIVLPFDYPDDLDQLRWYPDALSPTCRIANEDGSYTFAGLTDSSASDENQGDILRTEDYCVYAPDITYHIQELLNLKDDSKIENYDIWLLAMANETVITHSSSTSSDYSNYLQQLAYANYYNSMYGGYGGYGGYGYGGYGYGSYGGYGNYYNNYYNYAMLAALYSSSDSESDTTSYQAMMDSFRYYRGILPGPDSAGDLKPFFNIVYSISKE